MSSALGFSLLSAWPQETWEGVNGSKWGHIWGLPTDSEASRQVYTPLEYTEPLPKPYQGNPTAPTCRLASPRNPPTPRAPSRRAPPIPQPGLPSLQSLPPSPRLHVASPLRPCLPSSASYKDPAMGFRPTPSQEEPHLRPFTPSPLQRKDLVSKLSPVPPF